MFFLFPIGNTDSKVRRLPWVTLGIIGACVLVQLWGTFVGLRAIQFRAQHLSMEPTALVNAIEGIQAWHPINMWGYAPAEHSVLRLLPAAFVHAGWMHLLGNMFFLYTVGCNVEDRWGRGPFALLYVVGIFVSGGTWASFHADSLVPLIGASGAVAALMGTFVVYFLHARICFFWFFWYFVKMASGNFSWPAWAAIGLWASLQFALAYLETQNQCISIAYTAHAGGLVFGVAVGLAMRMSGMDAKLNQAQQDNFEGGGPIEVLAADPRLIDAAAMLASRPAEAIAQLGELAREAPSEDAVRHLVGALEIHADAPAYCAQAPWLIARARTQRDARLSNTVIRIGVGIGVAEMAQLELTDLDWAFVVASARELKDPEIVVYATGRLVSGHPGSRYIPKAMFETAMAQREAQRPELARATLERLVSEHPDSGFAERARQELG